jgi:hypothetical protein
MKAALLRAIPADDHRAPFTGLADRVAALLAPEALAALGSVGWYTTTAKLDLEARVPGARPQRLRRVR